MSRYTIEYSRERGPQGASGSTDASAITSGTLDAARLPSTVVQTSTEYASPEWLTEINANIITNDGVNTVSLVQKSANSGGTWGPMDGSAMAFLGDTAYLIGGWYGDIANDDWSGNITTNLVYRTTDFGVTWTKIKDHDLTPDSTHFPPAHTMAFCVHRVSGTDYIYLFCGDITDNWGDVYRSSNGSTWTKVNSTTTAYDGTVLMAAGTLGGNLYLVGGCTTLNTADHKRVVYKSTDNGATWASLGNASWSARVCNDRLVEHDGKLWLIGGGVYDDTLGRQYFNDVWSFDGTTWTQVLANGHSQWAGRFYANTFSLGGWMYISRGTVSPGENIANTFRSRDGVTWFPVDVTLIASHADALATHATGALIGPGNGHLLNNVNTNSPTYLLRIDGSDIASGVQSLVNSAVQSVADDLAELEENPVSTFNGTITAQSGRPVKTYFGYTTYYGDAGGYLIGSRFRGPSDTDLGFIGAIGTGDNLYSYIIGEYGDEIVTLYNTTKATTFNGTVSALSLNADVGSDKPLKSYRDASYSGWHNGTSLSSNESYFMGGSYHYFDVGGVHRLRIGSDSQFTGALTVTGYLNIGSADCRMFRDSGNFYFESDGNFSFHDTSTQAALMLLANDGRLFLKTNVWHPDSDGNARLLYNGSGGATNFNGAYNFVSNDRGHGFKSDGTVVWGQDQVSNSRGLLSWGPDLAIVTSPLNMDIICGGAMGLTAPSGFTFNGLVACGSGTSSPIVRINGGSTIGIGASIEFQAAGSTIGYVGRASYVSSGGINTNDMAYYAHTGLGHNFIVNGGFSSAFSVTSAGNITATGTAKLGDFTVATLPSASAYAGHECNVTDSSVTTFGSTVAGGGSSRVKLYSNGTNWTVQAV